MKAFFLPAISLVGCLSVLGATPNQIALENLQTTPAVQILGVGAVIDNGTIKLGVRDEGNLNIGGVGSASIDNAPFDGPTVDVGLRFMTANGEYESTAPGCLCEGWGVAVAEDFTGASANVAAGGVQNMVLSSFTSPDAFASKAVSVVNALSGGPGHLLEVTHDFHPSTKTPFLYEATVSIKNISGAKLTNLQYARAMDWDVENDTFNELVTIKGTGTTTLLEKSHDDGFASTNPLQAGASNGIQPGTLDVDFTHSGPDDHGGYFLFNFGDLESDETQTFNIYYGAAATEAQALAAIGSESIELYSLGQSADHLPGLTDLAPTFIFGFKGVGGISIEPNPEVPEASTVLGAAGLAGLVGSTWLRRRAQAKKA